MADGGGRRLPSWMIGASSADQSGSLDNAKPKKNHSQEQVLLHRTTKDTGRIKESIVVEDESRPKESSCVLVKCKRKRTRQRKNSLDADSDTEISRAVATKTCNITQRDLSKSAFDNGQRKTRALENSEEDEDEDGDIELTAEDLVTIAEEYVTADRNTMQDGVSKRTVVQRFKSATVSSRTESVATDRNRIHIESTNKRDKRKATDDMKANSFSESNTGSVGEIAISKTGDPARDMLDLFLGSLLNKPMNEKKSEVVISPDIGIIQNNSDIDRDEIAPPMAKKKE